MSASSASKTIWPVWVRVLHWTLAASVIAAFVTHEADNPGHEWHEPIGYVALAAAGLRLLLGLIGPREERLSAFLRGPRDTLAYARDVLRHKAPRHVGHNPLGAWMVLALLVNGVLAGGTGGLFTTDAFWGAEWLEELHGALGEAFVPLVGLHLLGVVHASLMQRESLVAAMFHGRKRAPGPGDVEK